MTAWHDSWKNKMPEFSFKDFFNSIWPEDFSASETVAELFSGSKEYTDKKVVEDLVEVAVHGPPVVVPSQPGMVIPGKYPGGIRNPRYPSDARGDRPPPSFSDEALMLQYMISNGIVNK